MMVIKNNAIHGVTASSEDPEYPVGNLLSDHPTECWRAADSSVTAATISVQVAGRTGGLGMVGINADSVAVTVSDPNGISWPNVEWQNVEWQDVPDAVDIEQSISGERGSAALWVSFEEFRASVVIEIKLYKQTGSETVLSAGSLVVGEVTRIPGLQYALSEGLEDHSIERELDNGARWYKRRNIGRTFAGLVVQKRKPYFYDFLLGVAREYGKRPLMWNLVDIDTWSGDAVLYGHLSVMPSGKHLSISRSRIDFQIEEDL